MEETRRLIEAHGKNVFNMQQSIYKKVMDSYVHEVKKNTLFDKISACYSQFQNNIDESKLTQLSRKVTDRILQIWNENAVSYSQSCEFSCTYIYMVPEDQVEKWGGIFHVFSITLRNGFSFFVDGDCLKYSSWDDFLENNELPKCYLFYPKFGQYRDHSGRFAAVDVVSSKSAACQPKKAMRSFLETAGTLSGLIAGGILLSNPVSLPVLAGAAVVSGFSGTIGILSGYNKLMHINDHKDLGFNKDTIIAGAETLFSAGGLVLSGAAACKYAAISQVKEMGIYERVVMFIEENVFHVGRNVTMSARLALFLEQNMVNIAKCYNISGFALNLVILIDKHISGDLSSADIIHFQRLILFGFNCVASVDTIRRVISDLSGWEVEVIMSRLASNLNAFVRVKPMRKLNSCQEFVNTFFRSERLKELANIGDNIEQIATLIQDGIKGKLSYMSLISKLNTNFVILHRNSKFLISSLKSKCGKKHMYNLVANSHKVPVFEMYNRTTDLLGSIEDTIKLIFRNEGTVDREVQLADFFCNLFEVSSESATVVKFYCGQLQEMYCNDLDSYMYDYFEYSNLHSNFCEREDYLLRKFGVCKTVNEHIFEKCLEKIKDEYKMAARNNNNLDSLPIDANSASITHKVYRFTIEKLEGNLEKKNFFKLINELTGLNFDVTHSSYESFYENRFVVITPLSGNRRAFIYTAPEDSHGILMVVPLQTT